MKLMDCLIDTKMRVFEIGDTIVHSYDMNNVYTLASKQGKLMRIEGHPFLFSPKFWSKVKE